jgi:uncharacterized protein (DUF697 family)
MTTEPTTIEAAAPELETKEKRALRLTRHYALWSMGGGLIPVIGLDIAAIIAVQIQLVREMSKVYGVEFKENRAKSIVTSLIASLGFVPIGTGFLFSVLKIIPIIGSLAGIISLPISAGAITFATGKAFIAHFESGGNFLNCNVEKMKESYRRTFVEGKSVMKKERQEAAASPTATT